MQRRTFLAMGGRAAIGFSVFPELARTQEKQTTIEAGGSASLDARIADFEKQIPKLMKEARIPGLSVAVIKAAKLVWSRGFGVSDAATNRPVDSGTIFEAASMSKPPFAYIVMKLCEKGVMNLDTPLTKYAAERFLEGDPRLDLITARHVLSHTSGFQNWRSEKEPLKIYFTPGERFMYSGEGYSYLQSVVAHVTGQPIEPYMKAHLFRPFGMASSGYVWNQMFEKRMARPHDRQGKPTNNKKSTTADVARYGSSGALLTTPTDYAKFLIEILQPKPRDEFRINQGSLAEMLRPQLKVDDPKYPYSWALGWKIVHTDKGDIINHGGDNEGFHCYAVASVERKSGFVIMTNGENGGDFLVKLLVGGDLLSRFL